MEDEKNSLQKRCDDLSSQNALLHSESEKLSAQIVTLTEATSDLGGVLSRSTDSETELTTPTSADTLWEVIRFVRREKEIAETKREMAENECSRFKQTSERLQRRLNDAETQLAELSATAKVRPLTYMYHC